MVTREEYLKQLKEMTDEIRKKDPSERTYEERWYLWHEKVMNDPPPPMLHTIVERKESSMMDKVQLLMK